jgi:NAD(P)-dependent dehydrogenase (short-subunit alcohol dehydrogenase family)
MTSASSSDQRPGWVITGPTSGIGYRTALRLAVHGTVVLVGRDPGRLKTVEDQINARPGANAISVVANLSDPASARDAASEIVRMHLPVAGVLNNAGIMPLGPGKTKKGLDLAYATNHLGPFAFTDALLPHLAPGTNVVFITSAVEDPARKPAVRAGFRGSRFISVEAGARGEWAPGGSTRPGYDAYATSKQGSLAAVFALSRERPDLRFRAIEPGLNPGTGLARDASPAMQRIAKIISPLGAIVPTWSTPNHAASVITRILTDPSAATGVYYNENGTEMQASQQVSDPAFSDRIVAETRAFLRNNTKSTSDV